MKPLKKYVYFIILSMLVGSTVNAETTYQFESRTDEETRILIEDLAGMFIAAKVVIFKNQPLINAKSGDKSVLFGEEYLAMVKETYRASFTKPFPANDHYFKDLLVKSMVEVMEENRTLLTDPDLGFKGLIPATYAHQLSHKFSTLNLGVKINFTAPKKVLRNPFNMPDEWEEKTIDKFKNDGWPKKKSYFDADALVNQKPAFRYMTPLYHGPICMRCHGLPEDNPANFDKPKNQWTHIDLSGFPMEGQKLGQVAGGVSISILK